MRWEAAPGPWEAPGRKGTQSAVRPILQECGGAGLRVAFMGMLAFRRKREPNARSAISALFPQFPGAYSGPAYGVARWRT